MYNWRKMTKEQQAYVLKTRKIDNHPWHSPQHIQPEEGSRFIITAACYEHKTIIGDSPERMNTFEDELLNYIKRFTEKIYAWVILPNHYHLLVHTEDILHLLKKLYQFHGRTSFYWNKENNQHGRRIWCNVLERTIKSDKHFMAAINYIHHNPIKHGYVKKWTEWPYSSAADYIEKRGYEETLRDWYKYDISNMGEKWDKF
jgi:putative transposase